jgi:hypothetical protein
MEHKKELKTKFKDVAMGRNDQEFVEQYGTLLVKLIDQRIQEALSVSIENRSEQKNRGPAPK